MEIDFPSVRRSLWKLPPARRKIEAARSRPFVCDRSLLFVAPSTPFGRTRRQPPAPATRPFCFSRITVLVPRQRFTKISPYFPLFPGKKMCRKSSAPAHGGSRVIGFMDASSRRASAPGLQVPPSGGAKYLPAAGRRPGHASRPTRVFRNTAFMFFKNHESRNTACKSVRVAVVAQGSHHQELPTGMPDPLLHQCFPALYFQFLTANCCAQVHMGVADVHLSAYRQPFSLGLMTSAVRWRIPEKCAESLVSRENARSAVSVAASVALRARSAAANAG